MKNLSLLLPTALLSTSLAAQGVITRISAGEHHFRYDGNIQAVFSEIVAGDTVLLGGGNYVITAPLVLDQRAVIIGTGVRPDSSAAYLGRTYITKESGTHNLVITQNADSSELHGIEFDTNIDVVLGTSNAASDVDDVLIRRCRMEWLKLSTSAASLANNTRIEECVLRYIDVNNAENTRIAHSIFFQLTAAGATSDTEVRHCILLNTDFGGDGNVNVHYLNNTILKLNTTTFPVQEDCIFENNLFVGGGPNYSTTFPVGSMVINHVDSTSIDGVFGPGSGVLANTYVFGANYHPLAGIEVGGFEPGIYGGNSPWKEGQIPFNPHWEYLQVPESTVNGELNGVQIKATAQQDQD